jgi:predicted  nucleic acid-binding Zn-ribbon protein
MSEGILIAVIGAVVAVVTSLLTQHVTLRKWELGEKIKIDADATVAITNASMSLIQPLRDEIASLREDNVKINEELDELRSELEKWKDWAERLANQIRDIGHEPVPMRPHRHR